MTLLGQTTLENAELFIDDEAGAQVDNLTAKNAVISLGAGEHTIGTIEGDAKSIELRDLEKGSVSVNSNIGALTISTTGSESDRYANARLAAEALNEAVTIATNDPSNNSQIFVQEGDVNNAFTATVNSSGELVDVHEVKNTKLDAYSSVSSLAAIEWRSELNDLNKRMGDLRDNPGAIGAWARLYGSEQEYGAQNITNKSASVQVGGDYQIGAWKVGGAFSYTDGSSTYDAGEADNETYTVAVYGTWLAENGMFLDLIGKYGRLSNDFELGSMSGSTDNNAYSVSAEFGWRFEPCAFGFIEPQAEITYGRITGDTVTTSNNVRISQDDFDTLIGRLGVRVGAKFPNDRGNVYLRVSGAYDFKGENDASVRSLTGAATTKLHDDLGGGWIETAVGANFRWSDATNIYVDLERNNGGEVVENWRWNVGMRYEF